MSLVLLCALSVGQFGGIAREMTIVDSDGTQHTAIMSAGDLPPRQLIAKPWIEPFPQPVRTNGRDTAVIVGYGMAGGVFGNGGTSLAMAKATARALPIPATPSKAHRAAADNLNRVANEKARAARPGDSRN